MGIHQLYFIIGYHGASQIKQQFVFIFLLGFFYKQLIILQLSHIQCMQKHKKKVWLDCDPGHDDMLAIILAALSQDIHLLGISTSAGNSSIQKTTRNTLNILAEIDRTDIQVYKGASGPLCSELETAADIHGETGLDGAELKISDKKAIEKNVILEIFNIISKQQGKVHFVVTGAMTNLAILLKAFPDITQKIQGITIMGGAIGLGNWSPSAEFNILVDPQAAHIVFNCGIKVTMIPLEVTHTVLIDNDIFSQLKNINTNFSLKLHNLFLFFQKQYKICQDFDFPVAHDPCTIYYLLHPQNLKGRDSHVEIQLTGKSRGRTNCTFMSFKRPINSFVCEKINVKHFWEIMLNVIRKIK